MVANSMPGFSEPDSTQPVKVDGVSVDLLPWVVIINTTLIDTNWRLTGKRSCLGWLSELMSP
jgi:hypothetical protein